MSSVSWFDGHMPDQHATHAGSRRCALPTFSEPLNLDAKIAVLGANLASLQDMAHSLPAGVSISLEQCAMFDGMADFVNCLFERVAMDVATSGIDQLAIAG